MVGESVKVKMALCVLDMFARWYRPYGRRQLTCGFINSLGCYITPYLLSVAIPSPTLSSIQVCWLYVHARPAYVRNLVFFWAWDEAWDANLSHGCQMAAGSWWMSTAPALDEDHDACTVLHEPWIKIEIMTLASYCMSS